MPLRRLFRRLALTVCFLAVLAVVTTVIWRQSYGEALAQLDRTGRADLALAAGRLTGELQRFRANAALTAARPEVAAVLSGALDRDAAERLLSRIADMSGSLDIVVADAEGRVRAAARPQSAASVLGTPHFERAMDGAMGLENRVSAAYGHRIFAFAAPVFDEDGPVIGALIVVVDVEAVEAEWRGGRPAMFFTDAAGIVFVSNRSELLLRQRFAPGDASQAFPRFVQEGGPFPDHDLWRIDGGRYLPARALHLSQEVPVIGLTGETLIDVAPARAIATAQAAAVGAVLLALGTVLLWALERRRTLARIAADLEARVARRTAELVAVNADLTREVGERRAAEARLQQAQADLVQAGKLSALGQMSAGISHELNQPLMAIRSFAENAEAFLARGEAAAAGRNLLRISDLARRMGRIIGNLRAFARQETTAAGDVDLCAAIDAAVEMSAARLHGAGVVLHWLRPAGPVMVRGGDVRLQQVVLNLLGNAADAMEASVRREITVRIVPEGARVHLEVRDTGPGIAEPEKMFNPFYTTKLVRPEGTAGDGMGLGLSISYGLVQSFGGQIRGRNLPEGGAAFTVELDAGAAVAVAA